jgi:hypothetical protein
LEVNGKYEPKIVTIDRIYQDVFVGEMGKEDKVFIKLKEFDKPMICNRSNFKRLETFFNSFNPDEYVGKQIVMMTEKVKSPQGLVDALRFSTRPLPKKELPTLSDAQLAKAVEALESGRTTLDKIKKAYTITNEQMEVLNEVKN